MGRAKLEIKKIEDTMKCQVAYSKRRGILMKKANEISTLCDVDVAFVTFSPSGRVSKFCNQNKIEDVLERYVNLPAEMRLRHIDNIEGKMEKLKEISHIHGDHSKMSLLNQHIENLELHIKKRGLEMQMLEGQLKRYEFNPEQDQPSLDQLSRIEANLKHSLQKLLERKDVLQMQQNQIEPLHNEAINTYPAASTFNGNGQLASSSVNANTAGNNIFMQLDPNWTTPYSGRVRGNISHDLIDKFGKQTQHNANQGPSGIAPNFLNMPSNMSNFTPGQVYSSSFGSNFISPNVQIAFPPNQQPLMVDQTMLNFQQYQYNVNATSSELFPDSTQLSTQGLGNFQVPRLAPAAGYDGMQYPNPNMMNQLRNIEEHLNCDNYNQSFNNGNPTSMLNVTNMDNANPTYVNFQDTYNNNVPPMVGNEDINAAGPSGTPNVGMWEWERLLREQNFNIPHDVNAAGPSCTPHNF